ncbi:MAG: YkgJ family cysteine cluster protein [Salinivirgaceae bacterium]|nr:YkgJ family cysteine cluster protein [Salinivirgaceae bacterium]MDD4746079.1 YkgJ family cysteine cluster protein [Salinivirgaceae bacterium]MDY0280268.1 YkgJ family cysteine cluster protein [Salinivirgaceae bacterium]
MSYTENLLTNLLQHEKRNRTEVNQFFKFLKRKKPSDLDYHMHEIHDLVFSRIDCLQCANCCRSLGPRITNNDINRLSKSLRIKQNQFIDTYLIIDEDGDYVFKLMPCPFLDTDNCCKVYNDRPQACREYPHLNRRKFIQILEITNKNRSTCPAVYEAIEILQSRIKP